jgi:phenylalanyl-tRNA synthetase beta subunit
MNLTHQKDNVDNTGLPIEDWHLAIVMSSQEKREDSAYYLAKNYFQKVLDLKKITPTYTLIADILENDLPVDVKDTLFMFDPNTSAIARYNGEILGVIGEIDNKVKNNFKLPKYSAAIDLNLQKLIGLESSIQITNRLSKFPESRIDLCFEVETNVNYADIHNIILKEINNEELIGNVTCLDIYQDKNIESKKKMTFRIAVRNTIKTLTDRDIRDLTEVIKNKIEKITRGRLI